MLKAKDKIMLREPVVHLHILLFYFFSRRRNKTQKMFNGVCLLKIHAILQKHCISMGYLTPMMSFFLMRFLSVQIITRET